jgi:hypothetical protein
LEYCFAKSAKRILNINIFNKTEAEQYSLLKIVNILPLIYRFLYHYLSFIYIIMKNCKLQLNEIINNNKNRRELRSFLTLPIIYKDKKRYSLVVSVIKIINLFKKKNFLITNCNFSKFKTNTIEKIKEIYEASCFKMDPIFVLEFDKKKYYEELNKKKQLQTETNNSND